MSKILAWSWSRLNCFEQCPKKFFGENISKEFKADFTAPHFKKGQAAHKLLEDHVKEGRPLKDTENGFDFDFRFLEPFFSKVNKATHVMPELQITFDIRMNEVSWFNKKAWCRIIIDLLVIVGDFALVIDYKTGKVKQYSDQLRLFAGGVLSKYPKVNRVMSAYMWVDHPGVAPTWVEYTRDDLESIWMDFGDRQELIQMSNESGTWLAKKNMFCKWCSAREDQCEHKY